MEEGRPVSIFSSPFTTSYFTCGMWSPSRPGVILLGKVDGTVDVWDFTDQSHMPSMTAPVASSKITSMSFRDGSILAVGDEKGNLHIVEMPRTLRKKVGNEGVLIENFFDSEDRRVKYVAARMAIRGEGNADVVDEEETEQKEEMDEEAKKAARKAEKKRIADELKKEEDDHKRMLANACKQIRLATTHQAATLPNPIDNAAIAADVLFRPVNELSGDVVDFDCDYRHFNFAISESAGNGTVAAMEAYAMHKQIDLRDRLDPKSLIEALNNRYVSASSRHLFTMSLGTIEFATDTLTICQAGAPNMYLIPSDPNRPIERLGVGGMPIGFSINEEYDVQQVQLSHDDCFIGFSENFTVSDTQTLENLLAKTKRGCLKQLKGEVTSWCDSLLQTDDISAVFFKYKS